MIDFGVLEPAAAQASCDAYAAAVPERVAWLQREVARTGGPALTGPPDDLVPLWAWAWSHWGVYRVAKKDEDVDQQRTVLMGLPSGRPADPARLVHGEVIGTAVHGDPVDPQALRSLYDHLVTSAD